MSPVSLADSIREYFYTNITYLPGDKQFHFASRLSSWNNDERAIQLLAELHTNFVTSSIRDSLRHIIDNPPTRPMVAAERRAPFFAKYPQLLSYSLALFHVRHLLFHYDIDARDTLLELVPLDELYTLSALLRSDHEALRELSTHAVNYIYLVEMILFPRDESAIDNLVDTALELSESYNDEPHDSLLLIYLFTHCIIGASNFYQRKIHPNADENYPQYHKMLELLENRIATHFDSISLDNKCEFLVCCKIIGLKSALAEAINDEAQQSLSSDGTFLVDTVNLAARRGKKQFATAEHRNVLYIMSCSEFQAR